MKTIKKEKLPEAKEDLGICVRCRKRKATIVFTNSVLDYAHGFTQNICEVCYHKMQRHNSLYKMGYKEGFEEGYKKALDDNNILYGKDAKRFLDKMKKKEEEAGIK